MTWKDLGVGTALAAAAGVLCFQVLHHDVTDGGNPTRVGRSHWPNLQHWSILWALTDDRCPAASDPALQYRRGCDAMHWDGRLKKGSVGA